MGAFKSWLFVPIVSASKTKASEVSSHFVVVQKQIDHIEQQTEEIPNRHALRKHMTDWPVHGDNATNVYGGQSSERDAEHDDHMPQEMQVTIADGSPLRLARRIASLNSARR